MPQTLALGLYLLLVPGAYAAGSPLDFVIIQPGQPGSTQEAQPVMDQFAGYVQKRLAQEVTVKGNYFNELTEGIDFLRDEHHPRWGIVSLGFFVDHAADLRMTPIASTRPGGFSKDILRLAVSRQAPDNWRSLQGVVCGTMLFVPGVAACELFASPRLQLPFTLSGTYQPLKSLRSTANGQLAGVVLDRLQYQAMQRLSLAGSLKIIATSKELPTSPVVWLGDMNEQVKKLATVLTGMGQDPEAADLLKILQTDGFGPVDPGLNRLKTDIADARCRP